VARRRYGPDRHRPWHPPRVRDRRPRRLPPSGPRGLTQPSRTPTPVSPVLSVRPSPRRATRSASSRNAFDRSSAISRTCPRKPRSRPAPFRPELGLSTSTTLVAVVGDMARSPSGRHSPSYLGLTPRESSTGLIRRLGAISKRRDTCLPMLLVQGAPAVLCHAKKAHAHDRLQAFRPRARTPSRARQGRRRSRQRDAPDRVGRLDEVDRIPRAGRRLNPDEDPPRDEQRQTPTVPRMTS